MAREPTDTSGEGRSAGDLTWGELGHRQASEAPGDLVVVTIQVPLPALDLPQPPDEVWLHASGRGGTWTIFARTSRAEDSCVAWLGRLGMGQPLEVSTLGRSCRASFETLDPLWATLIEDVGLKKARIGDDGWATLIFEGDRNLLGALVDGSMLPAEDLEIESVRPADELGGPGDNGILTSTQLEALDAALEAGYYDIPRDVTLRELAERLGVSASSLSERIRRAEARLVQTHLGRDL